MSAEDGLPSDDNGIEVGTTNALPVAQVGLQSYENQPPVWSGSAEVAQPVTVETQKSPEALESERREAAMQFEANIKAAFPEEAKTFGPEDQSFTILKTPLIVEHANLGPEYGTTDKKVSKHLVAGPNGPRVLELVEYTSGELSSYEQSEAALQSRIFAKGVTFRKPGEPLTILGSIAQSESPYYYKNGVREVISLGSKDPGHAFQIELGAENNSFARFRKPVPGEVQELIDYAKKLEKNVVYVEQSQNMQEDISSMSGLDFNPVKINS